MIVLMVMQPDEVTKTDIKTNTRGKVSLLTYYFMLLVIIIHMLSFACTGGINSLVFHSLMIMVVTYEMKIIILFFTF